MSLTESPSPQLGQFVGLRHSNVPSRPRKGWAQSATLFYCSVGILACACYAAFALVPPRWNAPGYPSYFGYGKNVEQAALGLTLLGVTLFVIAGGRRASWLFTFGLLAVALGLIKVYYGGSRWATTILLPLFPMIGAYFVWYDGPRDEECVTEPNEIPRWHLWATGLLVPLFALWLFLTAFQPAPTMDLHHDGEVISSAVDLVSGGVPFRSYFWPHGVSDSGVGALILTLTGDQGMGMILLINGFHLVLGFLSLFLMALGLTRQPLSAVLIAALVSFVVTAQRVVDGRALLPILAFLLLSVRTDRLAVFGAGALVGLSYVWRIDTGVFALATVTLYLTIDRYYTRGYARGGGLWQHLLDRRALLGLCGDGLVLLLGLAAALVVVRLAFGFPTSEWFWTSLVSMPRYHRDSTGLPLPLQWKGVRIPYWQSRAIALIMLPAFFLLVLGLYAVTLNKAVQRRLTQSTPRARFFLMLLLFSFFGLKSVMDRSASMHQISHGISLVFTLVMIDGLEILHWHRRRPRVMLGILVAGFALLAAAAALRPALLPRMVPSLGKNLAVLRASLQPTRTPEEMLALSADPFTGKILQGVGQVRELLEAHKVGERQLLVYHSASQIYPLLNRRLPTKYYQLSWAADPVMEDELISELEKNRVRAFLHVNGIGGSFPDFDVPDSYRIPRVHRYIASQEARGERFETELGTLTIVADP